MPGSSRSPRTSAARARTAARAVQAVFAELGLPEVADAEVEAATSGYDSTRMPDRDRAADVEAADDLLARGGVGARCRPRARPARVRRGRRGRPRDAAPARLGRLSPDRGRDRRRTGWCIRPSTTRTATRDPGTGYRLEGERWELLQSLPNVVDPAELAGDGRCGGAGRARARHGADRGEVPTRSSSRSARRSRDAIRRRSTTCATRDVLAAICEGIREGGARRGSCGSAASRTSPSSRTTARSSPARGSRSGSSRRGRRSSIAPTSSRWTTSSSSACPRCTRSTPIERWVETPPAMRSASGSARCRPSSTTSPARS